MTDSKTVTSDDERKRLMFGSFELHKELEAAHALIRELKAENARLRKEQGKLTKQVRAARHQIRVLLDNGRAMIRAAQPDKPQQGE